MSVSFIIPIYPQHYNYIYKLLNNINISKKIVDFHLVFSSNEDYELFEYKEYINKIIIDNLNTKNIPVYKKFYALDKLRDKYSYYIVCDAEIMIIPENFNKKNVLKKVENIYNNKIIYGGIGEKVNNIIRKSINIFKSNDDKKRLDNNLYYFWSDLPIYKGSDLTGFFSKIDYKNLEHQHFEHQIYLNYLLLYKNFRLINITELIGVKNSLENFYTENIETLDKLRENKYGFSWISAKLYLKHKKYLNQHGTFILYHCDRKINKDSYKLVKKNI